MARHLANKATPDITVTNRTLEKAGAWVAATGLGRMAKTSAEAASEADIVFSCVGNDADLREITLGPDGAFQTMRPGCIFVDHTTASADIARELHTIACEKGLAFLDAPVSGGQAGAENGILTVMCGGDALPFARAQPLIAAYARQATHMGSAGSGQLTKMVNQICIAGLIQGLSEGLHFAERAGLDVTAVIDTLSKGAAQSWQMDNRGRTMHTREFAFGFAVDWMRKDLALCLAEAGRNGADVPVAQLVDGFYAEIQAMGGRRWDTSSLIARLGPRKVVE